MNSFIYNYVDYIFILGNDLKRYKKLKNRLKFLNININNLKQCKYILDIDDQKIINSLYIDNLNFINRYINLTDKIYEFIPNIKLFKISLQNYKIFKLALKLGYKRILIFEDDFLPYNDINYIKNIFDNIPFDSYNEIVLDCNYMYNLYYNRDLQKINDYFLSSNNPVIFSACANIYDEIAIKTIINFYENYCLLPTDLYQVFNKYIKIAYCYKYPFIQDYIIKDDYYGKIHNINYDNYGK